MLKKEKITKNPVPPVERQETIRKDIISLLEEYTLSAREIARLLKVPEKEVPNHIEHIKKSMNKANKQLIIEYARCEKCDFVFRKREKFTTPGKCPVCKGRLIKPILFRIVKND